MRLFETPVEDSRETLLEKLRAPFQPHSMTSKEAAARIEPHLNALQKKVLDCLKSNGPLTDKEMQHILGMDGSTQRPRRVELWTKLGLIEPTGQKRNGCQLWRAK